MVTLLPIISAGSSSLRLVITLTTGIRKHEHVITRGYPNYPNYPNGATSPSNAPALKVVNAAAAKGWGVYSSLCGAGV